MLSLQAANCAGWQPWQVAGSRSEAASRNCVGAEPPPHAPGASAAAAMKTSKHAAEREFMKPFSMNQETTLWHITGVRSLEVAAALTVAVALAGCSKPEPQACPDDLPASCPSPAPTFSADVAPLIQSHCAGCHSADGEEPNPLLIDYDGVTGPMDSTARMVETQLVQCKMPPPDQPPLTSAERQAILGWIICGARND